MVRAGARQNTGSLYRFGPHECVIPYVLCGVEYWIALSSRITCGLGAEDKVSYQSNGELELERVFGRGISAALYSRLESYTCTIRRAYLNLLSIAMSMPAFSVLGWLLRFIIQVIWYLSAWETCVQKFGNSSAIYAHGWYVGAVFFGISSYPVLCCLIWLLFRPDEAHQYSQ
jgi:hypothetical protein